MSVVITCNAGSSNTKLAAFDADTLERVESEVTYDREEAIEWLRNAGRHSVSAIGHRVVHGGREFTRPAVITAAVLDRLESYVPLAPLHQPAALRLIRETKRLYPDLPQIACFDTAFHHTMPEIERRLPLPRRYHEAGIMRYGFHGLSYQHVAAVLPDIAGEKARGRVVAAHLGNGASACAMMGLKSAAATMGFSTLDGLMMGTRCGVLDPGAILHLLTEENMAPREVADLLYHESGLKGVSGISNDMRELLASGKAEAREAVEIYCRQAARQIAGLLTLLGGLDVLVFTGGVGENAAPVREKIATYLRFAGEFAVYVIPANEERVIAEHCRGL